VSLQSGYRGSSLPAPIDRLSGTVEKVDVVDLCGKPYLLSCTDLAAVVHDEAFVAVRQLDMQ
jgi:hypothetical protein